MCAALYRGIVFVLGLRWLTSRKVRERTAAEGWQARFMAYEGVVTVVMVAFVLILFVVGAIIMSE